MMRTSSVLVLLSILGGCSDQLCHNNTQLGAFAGDYDGAITFDISQVDRDLEIEVLMQSEEPGFPLTGSLVGELAGPRCGDIRMSGPLVDASGEAVGTLDGALTTTSGDGTWALDSGESGDWAIGAAVAVDGA